MLLFLTTLNQSLKFTFVKASPDTIYVPDDYATIQGAIDAANNGDVIIVRDGSYSENLVVNGITDLTLRSENGAGSTTISGTSGVVINIQSNSDDFTLGGVGVGFTVEGGAGSTFLFQITSGEDGVTVTGNSFDSTGNPSQCLSIGSAGTSDLLINKNTFKIDSGDVGVDCWGDVSSMTISENTFTGPATGNAGSVTFTSGISVSHVTISYNEITSATSQIQIHAGETHEHITYYRNTFSETAGAILVQEPSDADGADLNNLVISENDFESSTLDTYAFMIFSNVEAVDLDYSTISFTYNNILINPSGNTYETVSNDATGVVPDLNAENNWWNDASGPVVGDDVSNDVDYTPWLTSPASECSVLFIAWDPSYDVIPDYGCKWHITFPNSTHRVFEGNQITLENLKTGKYDLSVSWLDHFVVRNVIWTNPCTHSPELAEVFTQVTRVEFAANDAEGEPLPNDPCYWYIQFPNGTVKGYNLSSFFFTLGNGTYHLGIKWQGTYVMSNRTWNKTTQTSYIKNCSEIVDRTFTAVDNQDNQLWSDVTKIRVGLPNGTAYTPTANSSSLTLERVTNGTYNLQAMFEGSKVYGYNSFYLGGIPEHIDFDLPCEVYSFSPVLKDRDDNPYSGAEIRLSVPNSTLASLTTDSNGRVDIPQIQNGTYSIPEVLYNGYKVNQTGSFFIGEDLDDWLVQFNGLTVNKTVYPIFVHLNSSFNIKAQLVYSYTGAIVPSGSRVGLLNSVSMNETTDSLGWATFTLEEWQPVDPYILYGINEKGYGLTYPTENKTADVTWLGDFNLQTIDAEGSPLNNASVLIYNGTAYWKTMNTDSSGFIHIQDAVCQPYMARVEWQGVEVGEVSFDLNRAIIDKTVACSVFNGYIGVFNLTNYPLENLPVNILWPDENLYGTYQTNASGFTPQITQIPQGNYIVEIKFSNSNYKTTIEVDRRFEHRYKIAALSIPDVPDVDALIYSTDSTVTSIRFLPLFNEIHVRISGVTGSSGYFNLYVLKTLLNHYGLTVENVHVFFDNKIKAYTATAFNDGYLIAFTYTHSEHEVEIIFSDITLTAIVRDANSDGLENAYIKIYREGCKIKSGYANEDGQLTFTNLPTGNYTLDVYQRGVLVEPIDESNEFTMTSDKTYTARYHVYDLNIQVIDILSTALPGSAVEAFLSNGSTMVSATADGSGTTMMHQMPRSDYTVKATYFGFSNYTSASLIDNLNIQVKIPILNMLTLTLLIFTFGGGIWLLYTYYSRQKEIPKPTGRGRRKKES